MDWKRKKDNSLTFLKYSVSLHKENNRDIFLMELPSGYVQRYETEKSAMKAAENHFNAITQNIESVGELIRILKLFPKDTPMNGVFIKFENGKVKINQTQYS